MAANLNKVFLIGNLTRDPELRYTAGGAAVCHFDLAMNRQFKGKDGTLQKETTYIKCTAWGKTGENCANYLSKGRSVFVEGRLNSRSWQTEEGQKRTAVEVVSDNVQFLGAPGGGAGAGAGGGGQRPRSQAPSEAPEMPDDFGGGMNDAPPEDDVPF
ncbi:MAG: single-stranded DNA-binding protein [Candidatus Wallbacteria bacterium]|nr:single-stranded DNA-binding protein [Candidatus Wallbacteria bacterium]